MREATVKFVGFVEKKVNEHAYIRILPEYEEALMKIKEFSHLIILYWIHLKDNPEDRKTLRVIPRRNKGAPEMGVFGTRSPSRPNPIGLCVTQLENIKGRDLKVKDLDAIKNTPIIDIKPYIPRADRIFKVKTPKWIHHGPKT